MRTLWGELDPWPGESIKARTGPLRGEHQPTTDPKECVCVCAPPESDTTSGRVRRIPKRRKGPHRIGPPRRLGRNRTPGARIWANHGATGTMWRGGPTFESVGSGSASRLRTSLLRLRCVKWCPLHLCSSNSELAEADSNRALTPPALGLWPTPHLPTRLIETCNTPNVTPLPGHAQRKSGRNSGGLTPSPQPKRGRRRNRRAGRAARCSGAAPRRSATPAPRRRSARAFSRAPPPMRHGSIAGLCASPPPPSYAAVPSGKCLGALLSL